MPSAGCSILSTFQNQNIPALEIACGPTDFASITLVEAQQMSFSGGITEFGLALSTALGVGGQQVPGGMATSGNPGGQYPLNNGDAFGVPMDPVTPAPLVKFYNCWDVSYPTFSTLLRRAVHVTASNPKAHVRWKFPRGIQLGPSRSLLLFCLGNTGAFDVNVDFDA